MSYDVNDIGESVSKLANKMSDLSETATDAMKGNAMGDLAEENARLIRENNSLRDTIREDTIANKTVARLEGFALRNYTPTRTTDTTATTGV